MRWSGAEANAGSPGPASLTLRPRRGLTSETSLGILTGAASSEIPHSVGDNRRLSTAWSMDETSAVLKALGEARAAGRPAVLATVVSAKGSTPRGVGSRMLIEPERGLTGTIGGGCGEADVIVTAREVAETGRPRIVRVDLTEDLMSWSPAVCGGVLDVFLERI